MKKFIEIDRNTIINVDEIAAIQRMDVTYEGEEERYGITFLMKTGKEFCIEVSGRENAKNEWEKLKKWLYE